MELTYLGTAAAEGFPAVFCNCKYCNEAKKLKGKNIRTRSQAIINNDLLIDLPADTYSHFLNNDIDGDKIKFLIVTHSHQDHFYPEELTMRNGTFAHNMRTERLKLYCGKGTEEILKKIDGIEMYTVDFNTIAPFATVTMGDYAITALPAKHFEGDGALFYIIRQGEKTILYAHDTGYFFDEVFAIVLNSFPVFSIIFYLNLCPKNSAETVRVCIKERI